MDAGSLIRSARQHAGLSLRELARRAGTSHATLAAYESGRTVPTVTTLDRVVRACGVSLEPTLAPRIAATPEERAARGRELIEVLELAEMFPARHDRALRAPRFGTAA
jgi:transcriptional regulator with XRE-family HTH domain